METSTATPFATRAHGRQRHSTAGLWGHLLNKHASSRLLSSSPADGPTTNKTHIPATGPHDKAATSTRILLHDTQVHLEKFTERVDRLTNSLDSTKRELITVQKLYQEEHEVVVERMISLVNRCQTELQKTIGQPAQSSEAFMISKDVASLSSRLETLDKKMDSINLYNHTQAQVLQSIQDQQTQILTALIPLLPLLQSVPVHIENARDNVQKSLLELRQHLTTCDVSCLSHRFRCPCVQASAHIPDGLSTGSARKKRRVDEMQDSLTGPVLTALPSHSLETPSRARRLPVSTHPIPTTPVSSEALPFVSTPRLLAKSRPRDSLSKPLHSARRSISSAPSISASIQPDGGSAGSYTSPTRQRLPSSTVSASLQAAAITSSPASTLGRTFSKCNRARNELASDPADHTLPSPAGGSSTPYSTSRPAVMTSKPTALPQSPNGQPAGLRAHLTSSPESDAFTQASLPAVSSRTQAPSTSPEGCACGPTEAPPSHLLLAGSSGDMQSPGGVTSVSIGRPMSLKDRRALLSGHVVRDEGRRFIPLDDEEDGDLELTE